MILTVTYYLPLTNICVVDTGLPSHYGGSGLNSTNKTGSPNRKRAAFAKLQPPKPWLRDLGEPSLAKTPAQNQASSSMIFGPGVSFEGYVNLTENDLDILADYEEE